MKADKLKILKPHRTWIRVSENVQERVGAEKKRTSSLNILNMPTAILNSLAYEALMYGPALKVLCWFHLKKKMEIVGGNRKRPLYGCTNNGKISFPYEEANARGLSVQQFSHALKLLQAFGFIDISRTGNAARGEYTLYALSERWRDFGTPNFNRTEFPQQTRNHSALLRAKQGKGPKSPTLKTANRDGKVKNTMKSHREKKSDLETIHDELSSTNPKFTDERL